jgi:stage V sporulation protein R
MNLISTGAEWDVDLIGRLEREIGTYAAAYGLDTYPNQIEIITSEQMLDAYAGAGLPVGYPHWSYGKEFIRNEQAYRKGYQALAYEIVINSNPCIAYLMEENTATMQALVIAHACFGHNSFFKGNYLFQQWTEPDAILDYLVFARRYVMAREEQYGHAEVEAILDACHALNRHGVDRFKRPQPLSAKNQRARENARRAHEQQHYNDLWRTLPRREANGDAGSRRGFPVEPEENLLYFIEKHSPKLEPWQRELVRIVRKVAQYFYPQTQTKLMNEGWATFWHHELVNRLYDDRRVDDAFMLEFLQSHTNVITQMSFDRRGLGDINPYALGFAMFQDLKRICVAPTAEDRRWFPDVAGTDWRKTLDFAMRNFKDASFVGQFLSPKVIRDFRLFAIADHEKDSDFVVDAIHDESGYTRVRKLLSEQYARETYVPDIQVVRYESDGNRSLTLRHAQHRDRPLEMKDADEVMKHLAQLWGFPVRLEVVDPSGKVKTTLECSSGSQPSSARPRPAGF